MSASTLDLARRALSLARKKGAQGARTSAYRTRSSSVEWRDGKLDRLQEATEVGLSLTLYIDGRYSGNSTSDLRPTALERFVEETVATTRRLARDEHRRLADPGRYAGRFQGDLKVHDAAGLAAVSPAERRRTAQAVEAGARSVKVVDQIISVSTSASDTTLEVALATSNGMEGERRTTSFALFAETSVRDEGARKPEGWWYGVARQRARLPGVEEVGRTATLRAQAQRGARPLGTGMYPCVVEACVAGRLLQDLLSPLAGHAIQQQRSFYIGKQGQSVASSLLSITDDPLLPEGLASRAYDSEGMALSRLPLIDAGVLRSYYLDTYYASKLGVAATTGTATNIVLPTGSKDLPGLLRAMGRGILITGFNGGNSNGATGDFSLAVRGHLVEDGAIGSAVTEMNLSGNHLTFWKDLAELGNDPYLYSRYRTPSLRFGSVQFSGT